MEGRSQLQILHIAAVTFLNQLVKEDKQPSGGIVPQEELLQRAIQYAQRIAEKSPDSVIISGLGAREVWETGVSQELFAEAMLRSRNAVEGLTAYREKRDPRWLPSFL